MKAKESTESSEMMESGTIASNVVDPVVEINGDSSNNNAKHGVDSMLANFDLDCCGKQGSNTSKSRDVQVTQEECLKNHSFPDTNDNFDDRDRERSLREIENKMNDIDLETAAEDTSDDQILDGNGSIDRSMGKGQQLWYATPAYAALIALCGAFTIAIIVMAILLIVRK